MPLLVSCPAQAPALVDAVRQVLGAQAGRLYVADYSLRRLQQLDVDGPVGAPHPMAGTMAGRAFTSGEVTVSDAHPTVVSIPSSTAPTGSGCSSWTTTRWDGELPVRWERSSPCSCSC